MSLFAQLVNDIDLCLESYENAEHFQSGNNKPGYKFIENGIAQACVARTATALNIVFRGTDSLHDFILGRHTKLVPFNITTDDNTIINAGRVHSGFLSYYTLIRSQIMAEIANYLEDGGRDIRFTGHSLGGCVVFAALEASYLSAARVSCSTFASPKMGDHEFCRLFNTRLGHTSTRVVNTRDVVCYFPFFSRAYGNIEKVIEIDGVGSSMHFWNAGRMYYAIYTRILYTLNFHSLYTYKDGIRDLLQRQKLNAA